ncbi:MAG: hypothetical protein PF589_00930 [Gammaproteobacteria bacterium]|jgi:hypothetical protein|nr:hypothetical protein [Gammaproteobacteria bacterium]
MTFIEEFCFLAGFGLLLLAFVVGLLLLVRPALIIRLNTRLSKSFSLRRSSQFLEVPKNIDRLFYRHHIIMGVIISLTSAYVLYYFSLVYDPSVIAEYAKSTANALVIDILINTLRVLMLICSAVILGLGIVILFRPSLLKRLELWANRWISTRQISRSLSTERDQVNQLVYKYPHFVGLIITLVSLYAASRLFLLYTQ